MSKKRIGLMGGTFNPIHYGHLVTAEAARDAFRLDRVIFVPAGQPPHKPVDMDVRAEDRYLMTFLAIAPNPHFEISRVEIDRGGPSYTSETLAHFHRLDPDAEWYFITGADAVLEIASWRSPQAVLQYAYLIAASRPGYPLSKLEALRAGLGPEAFERIRPLEVPALAISSSQIRQRVREGLSIRYLLPEAIENYIFKNGLYGCPQHHGQRRSWDDGIRRC
jgi:nicotinate-nucleotide adenylyltransferase